MRPARTGENWTSVIWFQSAPPGEWTKHASCRVIPHLADQFTEVTSLAEARDGIRVCARCPVRGECLEYGRDIDADGVWGGELLRRGHIRSRRSPE